MTENASRPKVPTLPDPGAQQKEGGERNIAAEISPPAPDDGSSAHGVTGEGDPDSGAGHGDGRPGGMGGEG